MWLLLGVVVVVLIVVICIIVNCINSNCNDNLNRIVRNQHLILDRIDHNNAQIASFSEQVKNFSNSLIKEYSFEEDGILDILKRDVKHVKMLQYKILPEALMAAEMGKRFYIYQEDAERLARATNEAVNELLHEEPYSNLVGEECRLIGIKAIEDSLDWHIKDLIKEVEDGI